MLPWFLRDPVRFREERHGVEELSERASWLVGYEWCLDAGLHLNVVVRAHSHDYEMRLSFPSLYPDAPSIVCVLNVEHRISTHQYGGADGPLCLEWGPDNWHRDVTVVQMLESAYRLVEKENPLGKDRPAIPSIAPSRHRLTKGQELRRQFMRWYWSTALNAYLSAKPAGSIGQFSFSFRDVGEGCVVLVHEASPLGGETWLDTSVPAELPGAGKNERHVGVWLRTDLSAENLVRTETLGQLQAAITDSEQRNALATDGTSPIDGISKPLSGVLVLDKEGTTHFFVTLKEGRLLRCFAATSEEEPTTSRSPDQAVLAGKRIGVVGLGSAGSKIAIGLARMGAERFYLVDHDILLPENLRRHALDWQSVGQHKVDATANAIRCINPEAQAKISQLHLTGQESNAAVSGALSELARCDLLVDASGNAGVFSLLASVARTATVRMVWLEVFGGGLGGLVARSRPGVDPTPQDMRGVYLKFCEDNPCDELLRAAEDYTLEDGEGNVVVASDADVGVIANHALHLAADCFVAPDQERFPHSLYLVGMRGGWVFDEPFCTIPFGMDACEVRGWGGKEGQPLAAEDVEFITGLLEKTGNDDANHTDGDSTPAS